MAETRVAAEVDTRGEAYALRHGLWRVTRLRRLATCGRGARGEAVDVVVTTTADGSRRAGAHGLVTCSSVWACPVCARHIRQERAVEVDQARSEHLARGGGGVFVTLTLRHHQGQGLAELLDALMKAWRRMQQRRGWRSRVDALGTVGWIRAVEVTYGEEHGWHPHLHIAWLTERRVTPAVRDSMAQFMEEAWLAECRKLGVAGLPGIAVDVQRIETAPSGWERVMSYAIDAAKLGLELARSDAKRGRRGRFAPFEILRAACDGEKWALERWWEYEAATSNRRAVEWSRKLRERLGLGQERSDDEITQDTAEVLGEQETVATLTAREWSTVVGARLDYALLVAAADAGAEGVSAVLEVAAAHVWDLRDAAMARARGPT